MRVPSYRKHSSGQARDNINGKDFLHGKYGNSESKEAYGRMIAEFAAIGNCLSFGKVLDAILIEDVLLAYIRHAKNYYKGSTEYENLKLVERPIVKFYGSLPARQFGAKEFKAVREWWLSDKSRSRQYVNKQMKRTVRIIKWAVGEGMMPTECHSAIKCVEPLRKGRSEAEEAKRITSVDQRLVDATLPLLTQMLADMIRFQQLTGCRPGEVCKIKPKMVDRSDGVWLVNLVEHKTSHGRKERVIYVGPRAQAVLSPYLLRGEDDYCFSQKEFEKQRMWARHLERRTNANCGNRPRYSARTRQARKPRKEPGDCYTTGSYGTAIKYAFKRGKLDNWSPNQLRHSTATEIRKRSMSRDIQLRSRRLWRSLKYEDIYPKEYENVDDLYTGVGTYFEFYSKRRPL